jgi:hypothetical protein
LVWQSSWMREPLRSAGNQSRSAQATDEVLDHTPMPPAIAISNRDAIPAMEYYETEVYLCGIGRLSSKSGYVIQEQ